MTKSKCSECSMVTSTMDKHCAVQGGMWGARRGMGYNFKVKFYYSRARKEKKELFLSTANFYLNF